MLQVRLSWLSAVIAVLVIGFLVTAAHAQTGPYIQIESDTNAHFGGVAEVQVLLRTAPDCCEPPGPPGHYSSLITYDATGLQFLSAGSLSVRKRKA